MDFIKALIGTRSAYHNIIYKAIMENNVSLLKSLLGSTTLDLDTQTVQGEWFLYLRIKNQCWEDLIKQLVQVICNVNIAKLEKKTLHLAMSSNLIDIALELTIISITGQGEKPQNGDASSYMSSLLHHSFQNVYTEAFCMLLCYGADVYITTDENITPFRYVVVRKFDKLAKILIDYYDEDYYAHGPAENDFNTRSCLDFECEGAALLLDCVDNPSAKIFKLIWGRVYPLQVLTSRELNFLLLTYLRSSNFPKSDWLECLGLILEHFSNCQFSCEHNDVFLRDLFVAFHRKNIEIEDRLSIINICLGLGAAVTRDDHEYAYQLYGFGPELEVLIYGSNFPGNVSEMCTVTTFILIEEKNFGKELITALFKEYLQEIQFGLPADYLVNLLGFFSLPTEVKRDIKKSLAGCSQNVRQEVLEKLENIPEFPTLFELARNEARGHIKRVCNIKYPYQFHDTLKKLNFPKVIQDVIRFKAALY